VRTNKNQSKTLKFVLLTFVLGTVISCGSSKKATSDANAAPSKNDCSTQKEPSYQKDIQPIFANYCAVSGCHDGKGYLVPINTYSDAKELSAMGKINKRVILTKSMPPGKELSTEEYYKIKCWLENGSKNN
jgi:hypothetical protein